MSDKLLTAMFLGIIAGIAVVLVLDDTSTEYQRRVTERYNQAIERSMR